MKTIFPLGTTMVAAFFLLCCSTDKIQLDFVNYQEEASRQYEEFPAKVVEVKIDGEEKAYSFAVSISSPDTGCEQYADWWEIIDIKGTLHYRRILSHSHIEEQPFTRSGGPIAITKDAEVYIRVHMNNTGYASHVLKGSVANGFAPFELESTFAMTLENIAPLPKGCAF